MRLPAAILKTLAIASIPLQFAAAQGGDLPAREKYLQRGPVTVHYDPTAPEAPYLTADADGKAIPTMWTASPYLLASSGTST